MNQYFFKITKEERENILDKHKTLYDGYAVRQNQDNLTPLYVQDLANDKNGITVNNKGEVGKYNNKIYIKESKSVCSECGSTMTEDVCEQCGSMNEKICEQCGSTMNEDVCEQCGSTMTEYEMGEGIYDVEDLGGAEFDYTEEEMTEGFWDDTKEFFGYRAKPDKRPYMADAVQSIISNMKSAKTEEQLDSALNQYFNLIETNKEDLNKAYIERIMSTYRRKADGLGNYLGKKNIDTIMNEVEEDIEFEGDAKDIKESIKESLEWFNKFKKYN
jgi:RNA polymerase subunit RPABC4/transcription elongation factor Spt4